MKQKLILGIFLLAVMAGFTHAQTMLPPINISNSPGYSYWAQSAMTPNGIIHAVWTEANRVIYAFYDGKRVSSSVVLKSTTSRTERPFICANAKGQVFIVYDDGGAVVLQEYDSVQGRWLPAFVISPMNGLAPSVSADADGNVYCSFGWGNIQSRSRINGRWEDPVLMSSGRYSKFSSILSVPDGFIWCTWGEKGGDGEYKTNYKKRTITSHWSAAQVVNRGGGDQDQASLSYDPTNNIPYIIWTNLTLEHGYAAEVVITKIDEKTNPQEGLIPFRMQHYAKMIIDKFGVKHVAVEFGPGDFGLGIDYMTNKSGKWSPLYRLPNSSGHPRLPGLSTDGPNVALVWTSAGEDKNSEVWLSTIYPVQNRSIVAPINLAASTTFQNGKVTYNLSWAANSKNPEENVAGYNIYYKTGSAAKYTFHSSVSKTKFSAALPFTTFDNTIVFAITTKGTYGNETDKSVFPLSFPAVKAPSNPSVSASFVSASEIHYLTSWQANPANPDFYIGKYRIYKKTGTGPYQLLKEVSGSTQAWTYPVTGSPSKPSLGISSVSIYGVESAIVDFALSFPVVMAPANLSITVSIKNLLKNPTLTYLMSWQANSANPNFYVQKYRIFKKTGTGNYQLLSEVSASTLTATHIVTGADVKTYFGISSLSIFGDESAIASFASGS